MPTPTNTVPPEFSPEAGLAGDIPALPASLPDEAYLTRLARVFWLQSQPGS
jgi:hypothetical protein